MSERRYSSQDVIDECPGLTYRKLDYWCRGGCFGPDLRAGPNHRRFSADDFTTARVIAAVSRAFETERGGHAGLVTIYRIIAEQRLDEPITLTLGHGVQLSVDPTAILGQTV